MLDLDETPLDLNDLYQQFPHLIVYAVANRPGQHLSTHANHKIFPRQNLAEALKEELKSFRKENGLGLQKWFRLERSSSDDFRNFTRLVPAT